MKKLCTLLLVLFVFFSLRSQNAISFDNLDDEITIPFNTIYNPNPQDTLTIEFWFNTFLFGYMPFVNNFDVNANWQGYGVAIYPGGELGMAKNGSSASSSWTFTATNGYNDGNWHHFVGIMPGTDANDFLMYVDGAQVSTIINSNTYTGTMATSEPLRIGYNGDGLSHFGGKIDELRIWTRMRTPEEIMNEADLDLCSADSSLIAYFKFNQGAAGADNASETILFDASIYQNSGVLDNFALNGTLSNWVDGITSSGNMNIGMDTGTSINPPAIVSNASNATYQWLNCDDAYSSITGEVNQSFTPTSNGNYAVEVNQFGCIDTSLCVSITAASTLENSAYSIMTISPNPTVGLITIDFGSIQELAVIQVKSSSGKIIQSMDVQNQSLVELEIKQPAGLYFIEISDKDQNRSSFRIIKE